MAVDMWCELLDRWARKLDGLMGLRPVNAPERARNRIDGPVRELGGSPLQDHPAVRLGPLCGAWSTRRAAPRSDRVRACFPRGHGSPGVGGAQHMAGGAGPVNRALRRRAR
jgi:hypothetical protein